MSVYIETPVSRLHGYIFVLIEPVYELSLRQHTYEARLPQSLVDRSVETEKW